MVHPSRYGIPYAQIFSRLKIFAVGTNFVISRSKIFAVERTYPVRNGHVYNKEHANKITFTEYFRCTVTAVRRKYIF